MKNLFSLSMFKFITIGVICNVIEFSGIYLLTEHLRIWYVLSNLTVGVVSLSFSYLMNNFWTFQKKQVNRNRVIILVIVYLLNAFIGSSLLYTLTTLIGLYYLVSKLIVSSTSCIWNFFICKYIIYK